MKTLSGKKRYKVHYVGYSRSYDEWKDREELVDFDEADVDQIVSDDVLIKPFSLHSELALKIRTSLLGGRKDSPMIRIDMHLMK